MSAVSNFPELRRLLTKYSYPDDSPHYAYGTAGFRYLHGELAPVLLRVGVAAALLSHARHGHIGVMVTASHNTEDYNGVKLASLDGGMIDADAEEMTVYVVNERNVETLLQFVETQLVQAAQAWRSLSSSSSSSAPPTAVVHLGRDTRVHSSHLACLVQQGARNCCRCGGGDPTITTTSTIVLDHGVVTTPMLHHSVLHANAVVGNYTGLPLPIPIRLGTTGYYDLLVHSYVALLATRQPQPQHNKKMNQQRVLTVDCACGVGYPHLQEIVQRLQQQQQQAHGNNNNNSTRIRPVNAPGAGPLNVGCGSEYVQKEQQPCHWYDTGNYDNDADIDTFYCASLDGDADRIVFFQVDPNNNNSFTLRDGDHMACLIGNFLAQQIQTVLQACTGDGNVTPPTLGVVQTAYANGASTAYLRQQLGPDGVAIAKTGVKHVHQMAHDRFDVGIYFEANGHGTVVFGKVYFDFLAAAASNHDIAPHSPAAVALQRLRLLPALINPAVGDALSDLLLVDAILQLQSGDDSGGSPTNIRTDWNFYQDWPSRQVKVQVADRSVIQTNDNETICLAPAGVQAELDAAVQRLEGPARAFVRPSGTEDVVRIYAEAGTSEQADALAAAAVDIVVRRCGGVVAAVAASKL